MRCFAANSPLIRHMGEKLLIVSEYLAGTAVLIDLIESVVSTYGSFHHVLGLSRSVCLQFRRIGQNRLVAECAVLLAALICGAIFVEALQVLVHTSIFEFSLI